jgi:hypothetical protein
MELIVEEGETVHALAALGRTRRVLDAYAQAPSGRPACTEFR